MAEGNMQIKIVMRSRTTGKEHVTIAGEHMARAVLGDALVNEAIKKENIVFSSMGSKDGTG